MNMEHALVIFVALYLMGWSAGKIYYGWKDGKDDRIPPKTRP